MPFTTGLIIIGFMIFLNAVFAAYEMALASVARAKLTALVNLKKKGAPEAVFMKDRMEASLAVVQVGITLVGAIAAAAGGAGVAEFLSPYIQTTYQLSKTWADFISLAFLIIPLSALTIAFAELIPKTFALNNKVAVCLALSPMMKILFQFAWPVITVFEKIVQGAMRFVAKMGHQKNRLEDQSSLHELNAAVSLARASRLIGAREEKIVLSAAQLSIRPVKEIILPINDVSMIPLNCSLSDALVRAHLDMHTRFPVCAEENNPQTIQGYINFKDIMMALKLNPADPTVRGIVRPIKTVKENIPISSVLELMIQERLHIALVAALDDTVAGMVTLEDIIEELVGEIEDEFDRLPTHIHPYGGGWIMGGGVPMSLVALSAGIPWTPPTPTGTTLKLSDWASKKVGQLKGGEIIESDGLQVIVRKLRRKKLGEAIVNVVKK